MLNGHIARSIVTEGQQLLHNYNNTSSRTARRFLARYLTNPAGTAVLEVCFALNTGAKLTSKQYKALQAYAEANHRRFVGCDEEFALDSLQLLSNAGSPTKGMVTYTYRIKENLDTATTSTYRLVVRDIVRLLENVQDFDDNPTQALQKIEESKKARQQAEAARDQRISLALARMFG